MASRGTVDVQERRIRPVYDALDNGNAKKALHEADRVLKKQKNFLCAKALKGIALYRLDRKHEAFVILEEVLASAPSDEPTLQAMSLAYREMDSYKSLPLLYEAALKSKPDSEDILSNLFFSYVRLEDFTKQQRVAMNIHKLKPLRNPYYFWAVMSIFMQAIYADDKLAFGMYLPLAEKMTTKLADQNRLEAESELLLYLQILDAQKKYKQLLNVLQSPLCRMLGSVGQTEPTFVRSKIAECLYHEGGYHDSRIMLRDLVVEYPRQWSFYTRLIDATMAPFGNATVVGDTVVNGANDFSVINNLLGFFAKLSNSNNAEPFLARLEVAKRCRQSSLDLESIFEADFCTLIINYLDQFAKRPSIFRDIKPFLEVLSDSEHERIVKETSSRCRSVESAADITFVDWEDICRHILFCQVSRYLGDYENLSDESKSKLAFECTVRFNLCVKRFHMQDDPSFVLPQLIDNYLLLAAHLFLDIYRSKKDLQFMLQTAALLDKGIARSPSNHYMRAVLISIYCSIGAFGPCIPLYEAMDIKYLLSDSLGYVVTTQLIKLGHFSSALQLYGSMISFYSSSLRDLTENIIVSYKYGSFKQIPDYTQFRRSLMSSWQYAFVTIEDIFVSILMEADTLSKASKILSSPEAKGALKKFSWNELIDNRDFSVFVNWDVPGRAPTDEKAQKDSFTQEKDWLRLRALLLHQLVVTVHLFDSGTSSVETRVQTQTPAVAKLQISNGDADLNTNSSAANAEQVHTGDGFDLVVACEDLMSHIRFCSEKYCTGSNVLAFSLTPFSRIDEFLTDDFTVVVSNISDVLKYLYNSEFHPDNELDAVKDCDPVAALSSIKETFKKVVEKLNKSTLISTGVPPSEATISDLRFDGLVSFTNYVDLVSYVCVCFGAITRFLGKIETTGVSNPRKQNRKKQRSSTKTRERLCVLKQEVSSFLDTLLAQMSNVSEIVQAAEVDIVAIELKNLKIYPLEKQVDDECVDLYAQGFSSESDDSRPGSPYSGAILKHVWPQIRNSYQHSYRQIADVLTMKSAFISDLKNHSALVR